MTKAHSSKQDDFNFLLQKATEALVGAERGGNKIKSAQEYLEVAQCYLAAMDGKQDEPIVRLCWRRINVLTPGTPEYIFEKYLYEGKVHASRGEFPADYSEKVERALAAFKDPIVRDHYCHAVDELYRSVDAQQVGLLTKYEKLIAHREEIPPVMVRIWGPYKKALGQRVSYVDMALVSQGALPAETETKRTGLLPDYERVLEEKGILPPNMIEQFDSYEQSLLERLERVRAAVVAQKESGAKANAPSEAIKPAEGMTPARVVTDKTPKTKVKGAHPL